MKNLCFILMLVSFCAAGQRMGLKAGVNLGKQKIISQGVTINSESSVLYMGGFFISDKISDELSLGGELVYSVDGGKYNFTGLGFGGVITQRYHYLSIPVLLKYHASEYFNINAGLQAGYLFKAEEESLGTTGDFTSDARKINVSVVFGAEANLRAFDLGFRYILGLSNINDTPDPLEVKLSTIQIYLGQTF
ncbi:MAG: porin family protein [Ekhidna sp.]